ncbi:MAG: dTDP-4-dehydrorhamnose reductase [Candidatus Methanoperedens sp.]|nr:dTDP-4-dehydrorhamnose reductase [Candidatus Methanoperedens sp.]MCZ7395947.1 dTDP-4-dehydrorhamnose reductase [Candidatus Methanoperedens sp.]
MKIAIIGANGQLGSDLVRTFNTEYEVIPLTHADIDVADFRLSKKTLKKVHPDVVLNCAAYVRVDDAEDLADIAFAVNALGARNIALICKDLNATLAHISTDYIFDGLKAHPYTENDIPNPLNVYGNSKLAGEYFVRNTLEKHYIIRSSSLFGIAGASGKGGNFIETMIKKAHNNEEIRVVDDMVMSPTYTRDAADMIRNILIKNLPFGIYHVSNSGKSSWYEFAKAIFDAAGMEASLSPTKTDILQSKAKRPMYSPLVGIKLKKYGFEMESWESALRNYLIDKEYLQ